MKTTIRLMEVAPCDVVTTGNNLEFVEASVKEMTSAQGGYV